MLFLHFMLILGDQESVAQSKDYNHTPSGSGSSSSSSSSSSCDTRQVHFSIDDNDDGDYANADVVGTSSSSSSSPSLSSSNGASVRALAPAAGDLFDKRSHRSSTYKTVEMSSSTEEKATAKDLDPELPAAIIESAKLLFEAVTKQQTSEEGISGFEIANKGFL